jgi:hypothetical protein
MRKTISLVTGMVMFWSLSGLAVSAPVEGPLPEDTCITWNNLYWTWASPVSEQETWFEGELLNQLYGPSFHDGWRLATEEEWAPFFTLDGLDRLNLFTRDDGSLIESSQYWNTDFIGVDYMDMANGYIDQGFGAGIYEMFYVRDMNSSTVPEPGTILLFSTGLLGIAISRRLRSGRQFLTGSTARH